MGTRFTVQVSRAQRVGEARVSGINFVFDIWGIGVGYWFCVVFFFFFGEDFWRSYCGRGDLEAFCICSRLHLSWMTPDIIILLRFKIREYILSIPHEFKKKREREVKGR